VRRVGIYIFDDVEVLDFAGPFEAFSVASRVSARLGTHALPPFEVFTVAASGGPVTARGGLVVSPAYSFSDHPPIDVLIVPGGVMDAELLRSEVVEWITMRSRDAELTASVCTGAFLLGRAGLLGGKTVTTHWEDAGDLRAALPDSDVVEGVKWVDEGDVVTAAGISAGIDMCLHLVSRFLGQGMAAATARQMDYPWEADS